MMKMEEPIRVAHVLNRMDSGGIEAVVMNYYRHMDRSKVQFDFYFAEDSLFPQKEELERLGAGIYQIPSYTNVGSYQRALRTAFRKKKYCIVHAHLSTMSVFPLFAAWRAGVPVRICHNHSTANWGEGIKTLSKYILRPFNKVFANRWFACGKKAGRWMYGNKAFDNNRVYVLPNAIDGERFAYDETARKSLRKEFLIPEDAFVVGNVGRFTYAKNHPFLLELFRQLTDIKPDAFLLLVGEGETDEAIHSMVMDKGLQEKVIFAGVRQDVNKIYSAIDVFCLPSHYEGFALVTVEAQASGLPCICSKQVSGEIDLSENVIHIATRKKDFPAWIEQIQKIQTSRERNIPISVEYFSISYAAKQYQEYIEEHYAKAVSKF